MRKAMVDTVGNGLVTWGIIAAKLAWLRRDVGNAHKRLDKMEDRLNETAAFHPWNFPRDARSDRRCHPRGGILRRTA